jgi:predicted ATPase
MQERLIIKNFGPIKSVDLKLGKITILIGEQASGKSTVAKVLAICRYFSFLISEDSNDRDNLLNNWNISEFLQDETFWEYSNEDYLFQLKKDVNISKFVGESVLTTHLIEKSDKFKNLVKEYKSIKSNEIGFYNPIPISFLTNDVKKIMDNPFYIPTERGLKSIFSLGKSSIQNLSDALFNQFALFDNIYRKFNKETEIEPLDIYFINQNGKSLVRNKNQEKYFSLSSGASGYQSTIPIVLAIKYYSKFDIRKRTFIIEEPEQNLFPVAQKSLVEFLTESVNTFGHKLLITTHSPYILTSLENLMYADKLGQINDLKLQINNLIDQKYWINQKDVQVYYLDKDKEIDLMDREYALIKKDKLDSVSEVINDVFDELLKIENDFEKE